MSNEELKGKILNCTKFSEDWLLLLENTRLFNRHDLGKITALLAVPSELGTLVLRDDKRTFSEETCFQTLNIFFQTNRFLDYSLTKRCFTSIEGCPSYKTPFVNWHFVLFPLTEPKHSHWINPTDIYELRTIKETCFIELTNGLVIESPSQTRSIINQSEKALYSFCFLRREFSILPKHSETPLDYIQLPNTPFLRLLKDRKILQQWTTVAGGFQQRYLYESVLEEQSKLNSHI